MEPCIIYGHPTRGSVPTGEGRESHKHGCDVFLGLMRRLAKDSILLVDGIRRFLEPLYSCYPEGPDT